MNLQVDFERLRLAHKTVSAELRAERSSDGRWIGQIASSPVATAAAISALVMAHRRAAVVPSDDRTSLLGSSAAAAESSLDVLVNCQLSELVVAGLHWLARAQNEDGGWGDCPGAGSTLAATVLVQAAFRLTGVPAKYADLMASADQYVATHGGITELRRSGTVDLTWTAAILAAGAFAGTVPWRTVPTYAFGESVTRSPWWRLFHLRSAPASSKGDLVAVQNAVQLAKQHFKPTRNPVGRMVWQKSRTARLAALQESQASDGSISASPVSTAVVVLCLAGIGLQDSLIVERGVEYLLSAVRGDASWPVVEDLSIRNSALVMNRIVAGSEDVADEETPQELHQPIKVDCVEWILTNQRLDGESISICPQGGWAWSDTPGAIANVVDTAGVLCALARSHSNMPLDQWHRSQIAVERGLRWLLRCQNPDGSFGFVAADSEVGAGGTSEIDATSAALQAIGTWARLRSFEFRSLGSVSSDAEFDERLRSAATDGIAWLAGRQQVNGSFLGDSFGNERQSEKGNPVISTAGVLAAYVQLQLLQADAARHAASFLARAQHAGGGWGPPRTPLDYSGVNSDGSSSWRTNETLAKSCTVEETAAAVSALLPLAKSEPIFATVVANGLNWLIEAVENDAHRRPAVVAAWRGKFWYHERLYPLIFAASALSPAVQEIATQRPAFPISV